MKNNLLYVFIYLVTSQIYAQIDFEKGYFIDNSGKKTECFIKNVDWKNNPTEFNYKLSVNDDEVKSNSIKSVQEFSIINTSKYVREKVEIDKSLNSIHFLSSTKHPDFTIEELFLKVLIEGEEANLYYYGNKNLKRYFFNLKNGKIKQLVYKKYRKTESIIAENNQYRQQLLTELKCESTIDINDIKNLDYNKSDLTNFFIKYNTCKQSNFTNFNPKKQSAFNLNLRPRLTNSSLEFQNSISNTRDANFENMLGFGFGVELEYIFPFNKNKWGLVLEPTYREFKNETIINQDETNEYLVDVNYSSIELSLGVRHYFFIGNHSKIFINANSIFDIGVGESSIDFFRNGSVTSSLDLSALLNFGFGIGYKLNDKYSIELRHQTPREVLEDYISWGSEYKQTSVILGYTLF